MGSAFYSLAKAAMDDLIDWHCWHRPTTDDVFRGAWHACFFWTAVRTPSLQALRKHEARAQLPRIAARSAPPSFCASLSQRPAAASQKSDLVYHLMMDCEHLQTPHLDTPTALMERCRSHLVWEVRTDFGIVGVYPRAILRKSDKFSQVSTHPGVDPPSPPQTLLPVNRRLQCAAGVVA